MFFRLVKFNVSLDLHVVPSITVNLPYQRIDLSQISIPLSIKEELADPTYDTPGPMQVLIGSEAFYTLFIGERIFIAPDLVLHNTLLGWVLTSKLVSQSYPQPNIPKMSIM